MSGMTAVTCTLIFLTLISTGYLYDWRGKNAKRRNMKSKAKDIETFDSVRIKQKQYKRVIIKYMHTIQKYLL